MSKLHVFCVIIFSTNQTTLSKVAIWPGENSTNEMDERSRMALFNALVWIDSLKTHESVANLEAVDAALACLTYVQRLLVGYDCAIEDEMN